ncbi:hypothetical protein AC1031_002561 [Aphanomyces cochlioides]|nr:hypothetical protein AC1031_002561 [Aphanomyces cochlioides]
MLTLFCVVVGEERPFPVEIDGDKTVDHLKKKIREENSNTIQCDADALLLYLAKNGLSRGEARAATVDDNGNIPGCIKMDELLKIQHKDHFGVNFQPEEGKIYVLVWIPEDTTSGMSAAPIPLMSADQAETILKKVLKEHDEEASAYSFSKLNTDKQERIAMKMRLTTKLPDVKEPVDGSIAGYSWIPNIAEIDESQRSDFFLEDIAGDENLLDVKDPRLPFPMKGTADVLLINRRSKNQLFPLAGTSVVIELKKKVDRSHIPQAVGQLVSCSIKADLDSYPLGLLTDLNDHWVFSWFSNKHVLTQPTLKYPKNAFDFLEAAVLAHTKSPPPPPSFVTCPLTKLKVDDFLSQQVDAAAEEMMERWELMADVVEPEFLMRGIEYAQQLVQSMPMYAHMYA